MWFDEDINNKEEYEGLNEQQFQRLGYREDQYMRIVRRQTVDLTGAPNKYEHTYVVVMNQEPTPKPAPTFMAWVANGILHRRTINKATEKMQKFGEDVKAALMATTPDLHEHDFPIYDDNEPVEMELKFYRRLPDSMFRGGDRNQPKESLQLLKPYDIKRPDVDNLCKFVLDALTYGGVVCNDDSQIVKLTAVKLNDNIPPHNGRVEITFKCIDSRFY
jgi:Holliday junction resolvase RusA-like endonuclease